MRILLAAVAFLVGCTASGPEDESTVEAPVRVADAGPEADVSACRCDWMWSREAPGFSCFTRDCHDSESCAAGPVVNDVPTCALR